MSHPTDDTPNPVSDPSWSASDPEPVAAPAEATPTPGFEVEEQTPAGGPRTTPAGPGRATPCRTRGRFRTRAGTR